MLACMLFMGLGTLIKNKKSSFSQETETALQNTAFRLLKFTLTGF